MRPENEPEHKGVVSVKHHGWDAGEGGHLTPDSYAARAQQMVAHGFRLLKFDVDVPTRTRPTRTTGT